MSTLPSRSALDAADAFRRPGGAAGSVVAGRLAKADPTLQIAIIEAGQDNKDFPTSYQVRWRSVVEVKGANADPLSQPAMYLSHLAPTSTTAKSVLVRLILLERS